MSRQIDPEKMMDRAGMSVLVVLSGGTGGLIAWLVPGPMEFAGGFVWGAVAMAALQVFAAAMVR